jgi:Cu-processing system ATP-binding protein
MAMARHPVELCGAAKRYGAVVALEATSLSLAAGEVLALVGHNGAGKTTLMKLILGLVRPSAGAVRVFGADPAGRDGAGVRKRIGFLPESVSFAGAMTGCQVLRFYLALRGEPAAAAEPLLERVGLTPAAGRRVSTYSKGMRQRLGLAQALIGRPAVLLLDEPTTGLDPTLRQTFYGIVTELRDEGCAVLLSSHALAELEHRADRVAILERGRLVAHGRLAELRRAAGLPVRIRVALPDAAAATPAAADLRGLGAEPAGVGLMELRVANGAKVEMLGRLARLRPAIADIEVLPPSLDEIYARLRAAGSAEGDGGAP